MRRRLLLGCASLVLGLVAVPSAWADTTYYAGPASTVTSGDCQSAAAPCRLDYALTRPGDGDTLVVQSGRYPITAPLSARGKFTLTGQGGQPRPRLIGSFSLSSDTLAVSGGATVRDLYIRANAPQAAALSIEGGHADNLILHASTRDTQGEALSIKDDAAGTLVTDTVARSDAPNAEAISFTDGAQPGTATAVNVTAIADGTGAEALSANMVSGSASVTDAIALARNGSDVSARPGTHALSISYSDFRPASSGAYSDGGGNRSAAPTFCDATDGHYEEAAGSPTIGAGTPDSSDGADIDPDGTPRSSGGSVDIGAYQYTGSCPPASPSPFSGDSTDTGAPGPAAGASTSAPTSTRAAVRPRRRARSHLTRRTRAPPTRAPSGPVG